MVKVGVIGAGHLGKIHIRVIQEIPEFELVGFFDPDMKRSDEISREFAVKAYPDAESLIHDCEAIDIVTPTTFHFGYAAYCLRQQKHIFIEKPATSTAEEGKDLIRLAEEAKVVVQIGHVERFNPAMLSVQQYELNPMFIECHRLAQWNPRGTDVSVVQDLMIHDLDLVHSLVKSPLKRISASGVAVLSDTPDIANARLEFANGSVANLTTSRISIKNMRKMRIFQPSGYVSLDFLDKKADIFILEDGKMQIPNPENAMKVEFGTDSNKKNLLVFSPEAPAVNAIKMELEEFRKSVEDGAPIRVTLQDGVAAVETAAAIIEKIQGAMK